MNFPFETENNIFSSTALLIIIIILSGTIIILSYYYFKLSHFLREKNQIIEVQKGIIREKEHQISKEREKQKKEKETNNRFLKILSHDLRNPISAIRGYGELIIRQYNSLAEDKKLFLFHEVLNSSEELSLMLTNILFRRRCQIQKIKNIPEIINLSKSIQSSIGLYNLIAQNQKISIDNKIQEDIVVYADPAILDTIIRNLISNAIKFSGENGFMEFSAEKQDSQIYLEVRDNGRGISEEKIKEILNPITSVKALADVDSSFKLGLIVVREALKLLKGEFSIKPKQGIGTTFHIKLPVPGKN